MSAWGDPGAGEIGGAFAGLVAFLMSIGKAYAWLVNSKEQREQSRALKLQAWHEELDRREADIERKQSEYRAGIEQQLASLWRTTLAMRDGYQLIAGALRLIDPENPALRQADELLKVSFPLDPLIPPDMTNRLREIHNKEEGRDGSA